MITRRRAFEILRYLSTGGICVLLNVGIASILTEGLRVHYLMSLTISSLIVTVVGFRLNKTWTFRKARSPALPEFMRYALITGANISIGLTACALLVERLGTPYLHAIALVGVGFAPLTYILHRAWTFGLTWFNKH